jgi:RNA polymerase sigma factor (sigma-70 family)
MTVNNNESRVESQDGNGLKQPTDLELMTAVQQGEIENMGVLFERHHSRIYDFCHRMTGSQAVSEDLVQEAFMRALKYRHSFRGDSDFLPWLYRLARNVCYDHFSKSRQMPMADTELPERVSPEPTAAEDVVRNEQICQLRQALLRLPVERREALVLSRFEFRSYSEIADLMETSVGAVKVKVHRAMNQLREIYGEMVEGAES